MIKTEFPEVVGAPPARFGFVPLHAPAPFNRLTYRQRQVAWHLAHGLSNVEVSTRVNCGLKTVDTHRMQLMRRLGVRGNVELARVAIRVGFVTAHAPDACDCATLGMTVRELSAIAESPPPASSTEYEDAEDAELRLASAGSGLEPWGVRPPRYNGSSEPCDMWTGPCACGATHVEGR